MDILFSFSLSLPLTLKIHKKYLKKERNAKSNNYEEVNYVYSLTKKLNSNSIFLFIAF